MKIIKYPLLYFNVNEEAVLGLLVGTDLKMVGKDLRSLKSSFLDSLQKTYKREGEYFDFEIEDYKHKIIEIKVKPRHKGKNVSFAALGDVKISLSVIYGKSEGGQYACYLPMLNDYFYYSDQRQLRALVTYFAVDFFNRLSPEEVFRHAQLSAPKVDEITMRVKEEFFTDWSEIKYDYPFQVLPKLADQYPYSKAIRKNQNHFPEAAWEMEDKVIDVAEQVITIRTNVLVVGKHGVGKSAVLKAAIRKMTAIAKKKKIDLTFWRIRAQRITASSKYLGEWQESFELLVNELEEADGILWVEDVIQLLQTGGGSPENSVASFMINFLQDGSLHMMGEVTEHELDKMRQYLPGFVECFQLVKLEELKERQVHSIMNQFADYCQKNLKIKITQNSISLSYRLLVRYYSYESFPGKAIRFLQQCVHEAQLNNATEINSKEIIQNFTTQTGLPELFLRDDILLDNKELQNYFNSKIIGQPDAVKSLINVITIFKAGLNNPKKPICTMLFAGPTGVGKTQSAKALADYFFGKGQEKNPLVRIDMSEFQHPSQIVQLIGGGQQVGKLVSEIREKPFAVLLLDEVEKADPSIFDALLTVLDEGILVDAFGRVTNFRNTIVIMTTNLGATNRKSVSFVDTTSDETKYLSAISRFFRPEFVNRIDNILMFNSLKKKDIEAITLLELNEVKKREGFVKKNLALDFSKKIINRLSNVGFDERYGARPLQRAIEQEIITPMSKWILGNPEIESSKLEIDFDKKIIIKSTIQ